MRCTFLCVVLCFVFLQTTAVADQWQISSYKKARNIFWTEVYPDGTMSLYCRELAKKNSKYNIEHVFAASWMKRAANCLGHSRKACRKRSPRFNRMEADLHNLFAANAIINRRRSNFPFAVIPGEPQSGCDFEVANKKVEPAPHARGDVARAILYMESEYDVEIDRDANNQGLRFLLIEWHCDDPVSDHEIWRNEVISEIQGTRNPFIDDPDLIDCYASRKL